MTVKNTYANVTIGETTVSPISLEVSEGYKQTTSRVSIELENADDLSLNNTIEVDLGYDDDHGVIFNGYVDEISYMRLPGTYRIEGRDILKRAIEHYIVSSDLDNPWSRRNIQAEDLVEDFMNEAGITSYDGEETLFTFGTDGPAEFNLMSAWDATRMVCNILAYHCYAENGTVYLKRIFPVPDVSATKTFTTGNTGNIEIVEYGYNTDNLRNKVVVFGKKPIYAEASSATTPAPGGGSESYLPAGFYKTAIVSSELIDNQGMAQDSADYNLELYNKLTEYMKLEVEGDHSVRCRDTVSVSESLTGMDEDLWFVYSVNHRYGEDGYKMTVNLAR